MPNPSDLRAAVRNVPDFPKKGIVFRDITPIISSASLLDTAVWWMRDIVEDPYDITAVAAIESRGFIFGGAMAQDMAVGLHILRKPGKLPPPVVTRKYELEYGFDALEVRADLLRPGEKILIVDDVLATGGTALCAAELLKSVGAEIVGAAFLIELESLGGRSRLESAGIKTHAVLKY
jgi:adenine phosphoribosyltransferase